MVRLGANMFSGVKISPVYHPASSTAAKSLSLSPLSSEKWIYSSHLESIFSDHSYVTHFDRGSNQDDVSWGNGGSGCPAGGDDHEAFSSRIFGLHNAAEGGDADFLTGLDDLDFGLDLEAGGDVEMDSLQDFIDSALEDSSCSFPSDRFTADSTPQPPQQPHQQPHQSVGEICKEEFLSSLYLRSTELKPASLDPQSLSYERVPNSFRPLLAIDQNTQLLDVVPTKRCLCMISETLPKTVYSMATASQQNRVSTSSSTSVTNSNDSACGDCLQSRLTCKRAMSPLFIDTSFSDCSQSLLSSSGDSVQASADSHQPADVDNEAADVIKWLGESQLPENISAEYPRTCENNAAIFSESSSSSLDLESFIDLDDYLDDDLPQQTTFISSSDHSSLSPANRDAHLMSPLMLSFLDEQQDCKRCSSFEFNPHFSMCSNISHSNHAPESSNISACSSPAWSMTDSSHLSPLGSMNLLGSTASDNIIEDSSMKDQLALLKLFSEENAESLLLAESSVPTVRFV